MSSGNITTLPALAKAKNYDWLKFTKIQKPFILLTEKQGPVIVFPLENEALDAVLETDE